ncbi:hypothetical protein EJB05_06958 [Eragrostis curvula]|uniref:Uncharacterized protein n=1 Tax=Eragrostis curvula TaxID=38414 RepID=A0A5J9WJ33_9POAL|nr:hypothetical protein EJB05_06958 [Eragrostis curvula]
MQATRDFSHLASTCRPRLNASNQYYVNNCGRKEPFRVTRCFGIPPADLSLARGASLDDEVVKCSGSRSGLATPTRVGLCPCQAAVRLQQEAWLI